MGRPRRLSHNVARVWRQIENLSQEELVSLRGLVQKAIGPEDVDEGGAGTREPRKPRTPSSPLAVALETPEEETTTEVEAKPV